LGLYAGFMQSDPGLSRGLAVETADRRRVGIWDRNLYAEPAGIEQDDFVGRFGVWMRSHVRLSIELVFAHHALSPIDLCFDMILQDAAGFRERFHNCVSAAGAWICVSIRCEPDALTDRIFVLRHCLLQQGERRRSEQSRFRRIRASGQPSVYAESGPALC
jgi:hypothetical protein